MSDVILFGDAEFENSQKAKDLFAQVSPLTTIGDILVFTTENDRLAIGSSGKFLRSDGSNPSWQTISSGDLPTIALTGDVTGSASGGSIATTIANSAVTYAKIQDVSATSRILGRITSGAGVVEELTGANVRTIASLSTTDSPTFAGLTIGSLAGILKGTAGVVSAVTGTLNTVVKWGTSGQTIVDSMIFDNGSKVIINSSSTAFQFYIFSVVSGLANQFSLDQYSTNTSGVSFAMKKARGSQGSATDVNNGDTIYNIYGEAYSGGFFFSTQLTTEVDGTFTSGQMPPGRFVFKTAPANGIVTEALRIDSAQVATFANTIVGSINGNAATATILATARAINGVNFDGSAAITVTAAAGTLTGTTLNATVVSSSLTSVGTLATLTVTATITGSVSGNAGTATALQTARTINGTSFDGTTNITVTAAAGTLTGTTLNATVVTSSLTTIGTITSGGLGTGAVIAGVTMTLGSDATGDIYYRSAGGVLTRLAAAADGTVLSLSGGLPAWGAAGSGTVTGSGTTDKIPRWSSSTALAAGQIFDNGTLIGLGMTTPINYLHIANQGAKNADGTSGAAPGAGWSEFWLESNRSANDYEANHLIFRRSNGTFTSPTVVTTGYRIGGIEFNTYNGTKFDGNANFNAAIRALVSGTVTSGQKTGAKIEFWTSSPNTTAALAMTIFRDQQVQCNATTDASSTTTGALISSGGLGVAKKAYFGSTIFAAAATTSIASLNIPVGTAPSSPTVGDIWQDTTQKTLVSYIHAGIKTHQTGAIWVKTADTTVTAATEQTLLDTGIGTKTLPAGFWVAGKTIRFKISGNYTRGATATDTFKFKFGTVAFDTLIPGATVLGTTASQFEYEITLTCRTTGASGTLLLASRLITNIQAGGAGNSLMQNSTITTDTTISAALDFTNTWSTTTGSPTISAMTAFIEVLM